MSAFDDLPPGAALPALGEAALAALQRVQESGETLRLAEVDEAELAAAGLANAVRQGRREITERDLAAAADRLVARGLAEPLPWTAGRVRPAGGLLFYAQLALHPKSHVGLAQTWTVPEPPGATREHVRISLLIDVARAGQACFEHSSVPAVDAPASVPVTLELSRLDILVARLVDVAFGDAGPAPDPDRGAARETVVAFADGSGALVPSRLRVDAAGRGELETSRHGLLGARTVRAAADRGAYAEHLRERLMAAG